MSEPKSKRRTTSSLFNRPLLAGAMAAAAVAPAPAVADIFLILDGIPGEVTQKGHEKQIEILSYSQSFRNTIPVGGAGVGKVTCGDVTVLKNIDRSSPELIGTVVSGKHIKSAEFKFFSPSAKTGADVMYYTVKLTDVLISSIDQSDANDSARIVERVTLSPAVFEFSYQPTSGNTDPVEFKYDCKQQKAL